MSDPRYGRDGLGPEPSPQVAKIRDQFFGDGQPPHDPEIVRRVAEAIKKRTPAWTKLRRNQ